MPRRARCGARTPPRRGEVVEVVGHRQRIELALQERQPARLALLDDRHLDPVDDRQAPAAQLRDLRGQRRVAGGRLELVASLAVGRIAFEHDARRARPLDDAKRPGADRVFGDTLAVELDHLAGHRAERLRRRQHLREARRGSGEAHLEGVAVERAQALDLAVVVEGLAAERGLAQRVVAEDLHAFDLVQVLALPARIGDALPRIHVVGGDELARLALERRIVGEDDAGPQRGT